MQQLGSGMKILQSHGIIHRDLKPKLNSRIAYTEAYSNHKLCPLSKIQVGAQNYDDHFGISTSPNGKFHVFLSAKSAVDSGVYNATNSLHRIDWPTCGKLTTNCIMISV
ncbi:uncharacterized protein LOC107623173 [Arachis ipaensis]|uniref:uncharacterized protein LOC107623173 n=1 Tax=Arachis ipaensis TaxID=130454 RepID=UPI000A2B2814|nr:uncharacterized protein LOC107623173 [Arachis ipaensis]XP_025681238.1 uncharacterized protein LOC112782831 [Arachis hypogaea]